MLQGFFVTVVHQMCKYMLRVRAQRYGLFFYIPKKVIYLYRKKISSVEWSLYNKV